jgi:hypothetical protein
MQVDGHYVGQLEANITSKLSHPKPRAEENELFNERG